MRPLPHHYSWVDNVSLALATLLLGLMAGFFWTYSFNVNLATAQLDGGTYAQIQSLLNQNVRHGAFFSVFFGSAVVVTIAVIINFRHRRDWGYWAMMAAALLYIFGVVFFTREVNLPLNATTEAWSSEAVPEDWMMVRDAWNQANGWRVATSLGAFALCLIVLVQRAGRR